MVARGVRSRRRLEPLVLRQTNDRCPEGAIARCVVHWIADGGFAVDHLGALVAGQSCFPRDKPGGVERWQTQFPETLNASREVNQ